MTSLEVTDFITHVLNSLMGATAMGSIGTLRFRIRLKSTCLACSILYFLISLVQVPFSAKT